MLPGFTELEPTLTHFTGFYLVLSNSNRVQLVLLGFTWFHFVSPKFAQIEHLITRYYQV